jgi:hypothetical protein
MMLAHVVLSDFFMARKYRVEISTGVEIPTQALGKHLMAAYPCHAQGSADVPLIGIKRRPRSFLPGSTDLTVAFRWRGTRRILA